MLRTLAAAAALALSGCAAPAATESASDRRDCFRAIDVHGYGVLDETHVRVTVSPTRHYILTISPRVHGLEMSTSVAIVSPTNFICTGSGWDLLLHAGDPPITYRVLSVERAPPDADEQRPPAES